MRQDMLATGQRKPVNLSIDTGIVAAAKEAGLNLSRECEQALRKATQAERNRRWREDHREWAESVNRWVEENGLPLEKYRMF